MSRPTVPPALGPALAMLWQQNRGVVLGRIERLEELVVAVLREGADAEAVREGEAVAHKLAGSLGTFGFRDGSGAALEAEAVLRAEPIDVRRLSAAVVALRSAVAETATAAAPADGVGADGVGAAGVTGENRVLLVTDDAELSTRLGVEAITVGWSMEVVADLAAAVAAAGDTASPPVRAVLVDAPDGVACVAPVDEHTPAPDTGLRQLDLARLATMAPVFVLIARDDVAQRLAAIRAGATGVVVRRQSARQSVGFVAQTLSRREAGPVTVLAVDDQAGALARLRSVLPEDAFHLVTLEDPLRLPGALEEVHPHVVVLDSEMPAVTGVELCQLIRSDPRWHTLPVVLLTASPTGDTMDAAFAVGADDVLAKSLVAVELPARLRAQVTRSSRISVEPLAGAGGEEQTERALEHLLHRATNRGEPVAVARVAPHQLAQLSAREGRAAGRLVLRRLGALLRQACPGADVVGRWSGDEFALGMIGTDADGCLRRLDAVRAEFAREPFIGVTGASLHPRFDAGVAAFPTDGTTLASLLRAAENALERARSGGGRVLAASGDDLDQSDRPDVVIVEDDEVVASVIEHALDVRGLRYERIDSGTRAVERLCGSAPPPRLVLLDVGLPGIDGFGVLERLRATSAGHTPVIVLTARSTEAETLRALGLGAREHIAKPFSVPVLLSRIDHVLATARR